AERDLVREMCAVGLDLFYRNQKSDAVREVARPRNSIGTMTDVSRSKDGLSAYLRVFLECWNKELAPDGEFIWRVLSPPSRAPLLAVSFATHYKKEQVPSVEDTDADAWRNALTTLELDSLVPVKGSSIFVDTFFRHVSEREILF